MTFRQGVSGNPHGNRHRTRHLLNQEFMQALLLNFRHQGKKAIEKVARNQPAVYLKILALLVPRELKIEQNQSVKAMTDEQLEAGIEAIAAEVWAWCDNTSAFGRTVTVKVKFADFHQVTRSRSFSIVIAQHDLLRQAAIELVRAVLPTAKGVRLLGVTVSNFDQVPLSAANELPLFDDAEAVMPPPNATVGATPTGAR